MTHVLVVEDDPAQAQEFAALLRDTGCEVALAANGRQALDLLREGTPDVVLTDLDMPEMDGLELVRALRRDHPALPVLLMTSLGSEGLAAQALRGGAAGYVRKRGLARELVRTLGSVLAVAGALSPQERVLACLTDEQLGFILNNDTSLLPALLGYLGQVAAMLHPCDRADRLQSGVALHEALLNAIEHGNLELSSELRQEDECAFYELGERRRVQAPYRDRRVRLRATLTREEAVYVVEDEGPGFDPSGLPDPTDPANLERIGGRGLMLIRAFMDEVEYNAKGNRLTLRKRYASAGCPQTVAAGADCEGG